VWASLVEQPLGETITSRLHSDLVRGVVLTDALIGTFARADGADLQQNICFLYHLLAAERVTGMFPSAAWGRSRASSSAPPAKPAPPS
jgi:hypothetical protein